MLTIMATLLAVVFWNIAKRTSDTGSLQKGTQQHYQERNNARPGISGKNQKSDHTHSVREKFGVKGSDDSEYDLMSYEELMSRLSRETNSQTRTKMMERIVALYGKEFPEAIYNFLSEYNPSVEARRPLLHLGIDNVANNEKIFNKVLGDMAPGNGRNSLLYAAVAAYPPEKLLGFIEQLKTSGYNEDDAQIAVIIKQGALGRPQITDATLKDMIGKIESRNIGKSVVDEFIRRKISSQPPLDISAVLDIKNLTSGIPDTYTDYLTKTYYSEALSAANGNTYNYSDLSAKGVPREVLNTFVAKQALSRSDQNGPYAAITNSADIQGEARKVYLKAVVAGWLQKDSISASREIGKLPQGNDRDILVSELVRFSENNDDHESALKWAASISDKALADKMTAQVLNKMRDMK